MDDKIIACCTAVGPKHAAGENGRTIRINNPKRKKAIHVRVDDCLFRNEEKKCDCMYEILEENKISRVYYVEFKGRDFEHGVEQLMATICLLRKRHKDVVEKKAILVGRGIPRVQTSVQRIKARFLREFGTVFCPKTNQHIENI
jgi:hypothetical protein